MLRPIPIWRRLFLQLTERAASLARLRTGNSSAARIAMMAMTTSSSIKVNAILLPFSTQRRRERGVSQSQISSALLRALCASAFKQFPMEEPRNTRNTRKVDDVKRGFAAIHFRVFRGFENDLRITFI